MRIKCSRTNDPILQESLSPESMAATTVGEEGNTYVEWRREWLTVLLFLALTAAVFTAALEWPRYKVVLGRDAFDISLREAVLISWTLWAKSLLIFAPLLPFLGLMIARRSVRSGLLLLSAWSIVIYALLIDILLLGLTGGHLVDFAPRVLDMVGGLDTDHFQWAGGHVLLQAWGALICVVITGIVVFRLCRRATSLCSTTLRGRRGLAITAACTALTLILVVGGMIAHGFLRSPGLIVGIDSAMPFRNPFLDAVRLTMGNSAVAGENAPRLDTRIVFAPASSATGSEQEALTLHNLTTSEIGLEGCRIWDSEGTILSLSGNMLPGSTGSLIWPSRATTRMRWFFTDGKGRLRYQLKRLSGVYGRHLAFCSEGKIIDSDAINLSSTIANIRARHLPAAAHRVPGDTERVAGSVNGPNVIILILESLNHWQFSRDLLPRIYEWSDKGLRLEHHYSGANISHLGFFSLFYSRIPVAYESTLNQRIVPPLTEVFTKLGYTNIYVAGGQHRGWARMDDFVNERAFSQMHVYDDSGSEGLSERVRSSDKKKSSRQGVLDTNESAFARWCLSDRQALAKTLSILEERSERPRFIFVYLLASRFPYAFLPQCKLFEPCENVSALLNDQTRLLNRYRNGLVCMEEAVMDFIRQLDPKKNLVIVTGDHGESLGEDGIKFHGTRPSEAQLRVPFMMVGPGVDAAKIDLPSSHLDVIPTLVHAVTGESWRLADTDGRDLLNRRFQSEPVFVSAAPRKDQVVLIQGNNKFSFRLDLEGQAGLDVVFEGLVRDDGLILQDPMNERRASGM